MSDSDAIESLTAELAAAESVVALSVRPASLLPRLAVRSDATLAVVNFERTSEDERADCLFREDVTDVLPAVSKNL